MFKQGAFALEYPGTLNWTVERTWRHARVWFDWVRRYLITRDAILGFSKSDLRLELCNGSVWEFRSADKPDTLRGDGLHSLVGHEAAFWDRYAWDTLRPALADQRGWAALNSTPKGLQNWFASEWLKARDCQWDGANWLASSRAFHWPTSFNPLISSWEIEAARGAMPDAMFRQEYLGEFVSDAGSLFVVSPKVWTGSFELPQSNARYAAGFDLAKRRDWSAWVIVRCDVLPWRVVNFGRMKQVDYTSQTVFLAERFKQYRVGIALCDFYQEAVIEQLAARHINVEGFALTATSRPTLLTNLALVLEKAQIRLPGSSPDAGQQLQIDKMRGELANFTPRVSKTGSIRYEAADGYNDDYVFALAMAVEAAKRRIAEGQGGATLIVNGKVYR